jgi:UDP-N-acetylmuramoyl-tripeptide--D-alanyl-D-alanine ligase
VIPTIGIVITTIAEEHTETLKDLFGVLAAETELIAALPADGVAIVNGDDETLLEAVHRLACCRIVTFGEKATNPYRIADVHVSRQGTRFTLYTPAGVRAVHLQLLGSHFALAALVAVAVGRECDLPLDTACAALGTARGAPRRMAAIQVPDRQLTLLDDCYNANPASMQQALLTAQQVRAAGERLILVLGDMLELGAVSRARHCELGKLVATLTPRPDVLITVGEDALLLAAEVENSNIPVKTFSAAEAAAAFVRETVLSYSGPQLVLVKGSRGVHLEEVTRRITEL